MPKPAPFVQSFKYNTGSWRVGRQTDMQTHDDSICRTNIALRGKNNVCWHTIRFDMQSANIYSAIKKSSGSELSSLHETETRLATKKKEKYRVRIWLYYSCIGFFILRVFNLPVYVNRSLCTCASWIISLNSLSCLVASTVNTLTERLKM